VQLPGEDARSWVCRITVDFPTLSTIGYGFPLVCLDRLFMNNYHLISTSQEDILCLTTNSADLSPWTLLLVAAFANGAESLPRSN